MVMNEEEFTAEVRKELLASLFPGDNGRAEHLSAEEVEEILQQKNWLGTATLLRDRFLFYESPAGREQNKSDRLWIESTADMLWTMHSC